MLLVKPVKVLLVGRRLSLTAVGGNTGAISPDSRVMVATKLRGSGSRSPAPAGLGFLPEPSYEGEFFLAAAFFWRAEPLAENLLTEISQAEATAWAATVPSSLVRASSKASWKKKNFR